MVHCAQEAGSACRIHQVPALLTRTLAFRRAVVACRSTRSAARLVCVLAETLSSSELRVRRHHRARIGQQNRPSIERSGAEQVHLARCALVEETATLSKDDRTYHKLVFVDEPFVDQRLRERDAAPEDHVLSRL